MFKRWSAKFWLTLSERLGSPVVYGKVLREAPAEARAAMVSALENLQAGTSMVIEEGGQIEVLNAALSESNSLSGLVDYWDRQIEKLLLGMSGISDQGSVGSYAAVKDRRGATVEMRKILDERALSSTWTDQLIKPFLEFNKRRYDGVVPPIPKLRWQLTNDTADLTAQPHLLTAGVLTIHEVRASLDLEPVEGGDQLIGPQAAPQPFSRGGADAEIPLASAPLTMSRQPNQESKNGATLSRFQKRLEELQSKRLADPASSKPKP
jgi:phage gp29-like protein